MCRGESCVNMEAEIGGMWPQAKEQQDPSEGGRSKEGFFPGVQREPGPANTLILDF